MKRINGWFVLVIAIIFVFPLYAQGATGCDAALKNIGGAAELYRITTGKNPANMADLYREGFVKSLSEFSCPGSDKTIVSIDELDARADFKVVQNQKGDAKAPLVILAGKEGGPGRAYTQGGEIVSHGASEGSSPGSGGVSEAEEAEPNNTLEKAVTLQVGAKLKGKILPRRDLDYYRVEVDHQGALAVKIEPVPKELDIAFRVMNSEGKVIQNYVRSPKQGAPNKGVVDLPASGQYYLELHDWGNNARSSEPYTLALGFSPTADDTEPNNKLETASPVPVAKRVKANILPRKDVDLYWLPVAHQGALGVRVGPVPKELEVALRVLNSEGKVIRNYVRPAKRGSATEAVVDLKGRGTYYLELHDWGNTARSAEPYQLELSFTRTADDTEPNDSRETASAISIGEVIKANILPRRDVDLYQVSVDKAGTLGVDVSAVPAELEVALRVMDADGKVVRSYVRPEQRGAPTKATVELSVPGIYYLELHDWGNTARSSDPYSLTTSFSPAG